MPLSISKHKLYLYLLFFIFLTSIFNFKFFETYQNIFIVNKIIINGISDKEKKLVENELNSFKNINIFKLKEDQILKILNKFNFIENIYVKKIIPSSININLTKTSVIGITLRNGENFYIGKNEKFINLNQISKIDNTPILFGEFKIKDYLKLRKILIDNDIEIKNIESYYFYKNKRWDLLFSDGLLVMLPSKNIDKSLNIFKKLSINNKLINIKIIDFRVANQVNLTNYDK